MFSGWFAFGVNLGSGISAVDSCFSVDVKSDFGAGTAAVISAFVSMFVLDFVTDVVTDFSSSAFGPDLDFDTSWATVVGTISAETRMLRKLSVQFVVRRKSHISVQMPFQDSAQTFVVQISVSFRNSVHDSMQTLLQCSADGLHSV